MSKHTDFKDFFEKLGFSVISLFVMSLSFVVTAWVEVFVPNYWLQILGGVWASSKFP